MHRGATAGTCAFVGITYCAYDDCSDEDRGFRCPGHREYCSEPAFMNLDFPTPGKAPQRIYGCTSHWEAMLLDLNDFPPDPGYGRASATFYVKGTFA